MPFRFLKCLAVVTFIHVCAAMLVYGAYQLTRSDEGPIISDGSPSEKQNFEIVKESQDINSGTDTIENAAIQPSSHTVKQGESYYSISRMYNISMNDLRDANNGRQLHPGRTIRIP